MWEADDVCSESGMRGVMGREMGRGTVETEPGPT